MDYRYGSTTVFKIQYHFVFVTKYRYKVLKGDVGLKVRELIRQKFDEIVRELPGLEKTLLGSAFLGEGSLLLDFGRIDRRNDKKLPGTSF
ncbi:transposase [Methyloglobulus morosus KoM1]|uniref:Transposase n=1 Tax=Methyloglobulus morosus KoM1 TaxID=1116472 RepID=V5BKX6_9GAMM|nr:transposase [Methyloglobulus morosus KoM1]